MPTINQADILERAKALAKKTASPVELLKKLAMVGIPCSAGMRRGCNPRKS
jgi:hypothetical protein